MTNRVNRVDLFGLVTSSTPKDVMSIDILFKDEPSPNIYVVDTIRPDDSDVLGALNKWNSILNGNSYSIEKETINSVVPSNQLLRPWDNVPRKALAQDVTGNRIVYGNYVQNYDLVVDTGGKYVPKFTFEWGEYEEFEYVSGTSINTRLSGAGKSIKSLREYQLGVVFVDKYGRETPVISNETGTKKLEKGKADKYNRINVSINTNSSFPNHEDLKYFKFYVKETSGEYYNMAMDRWYDAEDGNVWLAFPSSDRNKLDIDTFLILKKGTDTDDLVTDAARYKVIAIENQAPDFIKTKRQLAVSIEHSTTKDMYGTALGNGPAQGRGRSTNIEINYKAFLTTPGMHLDEYKEGKLYIEWEDPTTKQVSDRYEIVSIDNDYLADIGAGAPILDNAKYSIQLAENLGGDVNFITDDPSGVNPNFIRYGVKTNIYKYTVENRPQFDGRFFVKIYEDETFQANIGKSYIDGLGYRILNSKKVFYMKPLHKAIHTLNIDDFLVDGNAWTTGWDVADYASEEEFNTFLIDHLYGYYELREFASMALFFRRYSYGTAINYAPTPGDSYGLMDVPLLVHLKPNPLASDNLQTPFGWPSNAGMDLNSIYSSDITIPNWTPVDNWSDEFCGYQKSTPLEVPGYTNWWSYTFSYSSKEVKETTNTTADNTARDTEVWFIDAGPYAGSQFDSAGTANLDWGNAARFEQYVGGPTVSAGTSNYNVMSNTSYVPIDVLNTDDTGAPIPAIPGVNGEEYYWDTDNINMHKGIVPSGTTNTHAMTLAFGGIRGANDAYTSPGFFNIGNWNTGSPTSPNSIYSNLEPFVQNFNSGHEFRWKQDPTQTVYTIGGNITSSGHMRHSSVRDELITSADKVPGGTSMAELLSFNFTKNWTMKDISPAYGANWYPLADGKIPNSLEITLTTCGSSGATIGNGPTADGGTVGEDLRIFVKDVVCADNTLTNYAGNRTIKVGMAFSDYTRKGGDGTATNVLDDLCDINSFDASIGGEKETTF
jgi:hypothetical protein